MKDEVETRISPDGLRYLSKSQGSSFPTALGYTMSCYVCGRHRPRTQMESFVIAGGRQWRCKDGHAQARPPAPAPGASDS